MFSFGVDSNIMSLAGLAIADGDSKKSHFQKVYDGATEVGGAIVTAAQRRAQRFSITSVLRGIICQPCFRRRTRPTRYAATMTGMTSLHTRDFRPALVSILG